jgi:hypothetical protein
MNLTAEQIVENWEEFLGNIKTYIAKPRQEQLLSFYENLQDRLLLMPASGNTKFHNCFPGGYIDHVNRVVRFSLEFYETWNRLGADLTTFTKEELVFAAINHDLGKIGDKDQDFYIPSTDEWRKKNLGEMYGYNKNVPFMLIPDRSLFLLQEASIKYTLNEMLAIRIHDGLYEEVNKPYLISNFPESRPRTFLVYILQQADLAASLIEQSRTANVPEVKQTPSKSKISPTLASALKTI